MAKFTYYGGMALKIERSDGFKIMIDPYIHNSLCQDATPDMFYDVDVLLISHAAFDHFGETVDILRHSNATIVCGTETWARVRGEAYSRKPPHQRHLRRRRQIRTDGGTLCSRVAWLQRGISRGGPRLLPLWHYRKA